MVPRHAPVAGTGFDGRDNLGGDARIDVGRWRRRGGRRAPWRAEGNSLPLLQPVTRYTPPLLLPPRLRRGECCLDEPALMEWRRVNARSASPPVLRAAGKPQDKTRGKEAIAVVAPKVWMSAMVVASRSTILLSTCRTWSGGSRVPQGLPAPLPAAGLRPRATREALGITPVGKCDRGRHGGRNRAHEALKAGVDATSFSSTVLSVKVMSGSIMKVTPSP